MGSKTYNMDCMDYMSKLEDNSFDLAVVDPPYGRDILNNFKNLKSGKNKKDGYLRPSRDWIYKKWDKNPPPDKYFIELSRVSRYQIVWGINNFNILNKAIGRIIWDKCRGNKGNEIASTNVKKNINIFRYMWNGERFQGKSINEGWIMQGNIKKREKIIHPTQKPVALYKWLLTNYAKPGDKILDTHLGSGSSRIAAYDLGFDFVGVELDHDYFADQEARFKNHIAQKELFKQEEIQKEIYNQGAIL